MGALCTKKYKVGKFLCLAATSALLVSCSTNQATGERQFTGLLSPDKEKQIGASQHQQALDAFGGIYENKQMQAYVNEIGQRLAAHAETQGLTYRFYLLNSPVVNAFAAPGGYIYVTRGLLSYANSEAELAGVLAHEIGHITGRHAAERYSTGTLTQIGAAVASAALGSQAASQALGVGSNLFLSSYSRGQENESDELGIRYLDKAGYDVFALSRFLRTLQLESQLQSQIAGTQQAPSFFSSHPNTADRVASASAIAAKYGKNDEIVNRGRHMSLVNGTVYGDGAEQGFARGTTFYHPQFGFTFTAPSGYRIINQPNQVLAVGKDGSAIILDMVKNSLDPATYTQNVWLKNEKVATPQRITVNGMPAATTSFAGTLNKQPVTIRTVAIAFDSNTTYRMQMAYPKSASNATIENLKKATYSFRKLSQSERNSLKPLRIVTRTARAGDTVASLAATMPFDNLRELRFRALNGLIANETLRAGTEYKVVTN